MCAISHIAGVALLIDKIYERFSAEFFRQIPGLSFVDPHQGRVQHEALVHAQVQGNL